METTTEAQPAWLEDVATVVQTLIKDPVREAVREGIEKERQQESTTALGVGESPDSDDSGTSQLGRILGVVIGLAAVTYLIRRRRRGESPRAESMTAPASIEETGIGTGTPAETTKHAGPENETEFGTETSRDPADEQGSADDQS